MKRTDVIAIANGLLDDYRPNFIDLGSRGASVAVSDSVSAIEVSNLPEEQNTNIASGIDEAKSSPLDDASGVLVDADRLAKLAAALSELAPMSSGLPLVRVFLGSFKGVPVVILESVDAFALPKVRGMLAAVDGKQVAQFTPCRHDVRLGECDDSDDLDD